MSKLKQFLLGRNPLGDHIGPAWTIVSIVFLGIWLLFLMTSSRESGPIERFAILPHELEAAPVGIFLVAWGFGFALAVVRFSTNRIQALAGLMLLVWHFIVLLYLWWLIGILKNFRGVTVFWRHFLDSP